MWQRVTALFNQTNQDLQRRHCSVQQALQLTTIMVIAAISHTDYEFKQPSLT
jgi:hypothetical protein